jgi:hypothetical protein
LSSIYKISEEIIMAGNNGDYEGRTVIETIDHLDKTRGGKWQYLSTQGVYVRLSQRNGHSAARQKGDKNPAYKSCLDSQLIPDEFFTPASMEIIKRQREEAKRARAESAALLSE